MIEKIDFGERDTPYKSKKKRSRPKKADHKHEYQNVIIHAKYPKNYPIPRLAGQDYIALDSFCTKCGKLGYAQEDKEVEKLFPHISVGHYGLISLQVNYKDEWEEYQKWCKENYPHYTMENYSNSFCRVGQTFLDLNAVVWPQK